MSDTVGDFGFAETKSCNCAFFGVKEFGVTRIVGQYEPSMVSMSCVKRASHAHDADSQKDCSRRFEDEQPSAFTSAFQTLLESAQL